MEFIQSVDEIVVEFMSGIFKNPVFEAKYVIAMDDEIETKLNIAHINESQVYEWLPYTHGEIVPEGENERKEWLKGMNITSETTDQEVMSAGGYGYAVRFAKTAARFRKELVAKYGEERGAKIRYAEAFELCEYGSQPTKEFEKALFGF